MPHRSRPHRPCDTRALARPSVPARSRWPQARTSGGGHGPAKRVEGHPMSNTGASAASEPHDGPVADGVTGPPRRPSLPADDDARASAVDAVDFNFEEIGDHIYDGVYIADGKGKTLYINKSFTRITGIRPDEVVGQYVQDLVAKGIYKNAVTPEVLKQRKQVNSVGESVRNGVQMLITGNPIFDSHGNIKLVVVVEHEMPDLVKMQLELENTQQKMKAVEADRLRHRQELEHLRKQITSNSMIGTSTEIQAILRLVEQIAGVDVTVLIHGETGVGKEVVANEIFLNGPRKGQPFIKVNCAAIPTNLLEAELFGYERGAFTGALTAGKMGLFELADRGTLLLDEIGDLPLDLQSKLLRAIQDKEITRVGATKPQHLDVRILAATNLDLRERVKQGLFREDLFYRLSVFPIYIPPLRSRPKDIEDLARHFLQQYNNKYSKSIHINRAGLDLMQEYRWPGNARELQNVIERLVLISDHYAVVGAEPIASLLKIGDDGAGRIDMERGLKAIVDDLERRTIETTLAQCGSTRKAAQLLRIDQSTIVKKAKRLGIRIAPA
ncbi:sigma-54 interaction domain-containing protein [Azospirillum sp. A39]|uniref:sigma-54 interaction domain-containing protein n=1 Tax=Azospirillum sp. A39 TaxID=3462279 RepID=UPI0040461ADD